MSKSSLLSSVIVLVCLPGLAQVASSNSGTEIASAALNSSSSSSASTSSNAIDASAGVMVVPPVSPRKKDSGEEIRILPFSRFAIGTKLGTLGWGGQIATPLTRRLTLRGGADFFNFGYGVTSDGTNYYGSIHMKSGTVQVDVYPFRHASFHISPGFLIFHPNLAATMNVPGGATFTENHTDYISDPNDPVSGTGGVTFQRTVMPELTLGFGNMITRRENRHWSAPFEIGLAYTGHTTLNVNLTGSACQAGQGCGSVNDPSIQGNVTQQTSKINEELKRFQIYPILTSGVAFRF